MALGCSGYPSPCWDADCRHLVSPPTGVLLGTALLQCCLEAFESGRPPQALFLTCWVG